MFPTDGSSTVLSFSSTIPGGDIDYAGLISDKNIINQLAKDLVFGFNLDLGYLTAFGDTKETPFFKIFMLEDRDL